MSLTKFSMNIGKCTEDESGKSFFISASLKPLNSSCVVGFIASMLSVVSTTPNVSLVTYIQISIILRFYIYYLKYILK